MCVGAGGEGGNPKSGFGTRNRNPHANSRIRTPGPTPEPTFRIRAWNAHARAEFRTKLRVPRLVSGPAPTFATRSHSGYTFGFRIRLTGLGCRVQGSECGPGGNFRIRIPKSGPEVWFRIRGLNAAFQFRCRIRVTKLPPERGVPHVSRLGMRVPRSDSACGFRLGFRAGVSNSESDAGFQVRV